MNDTTKAVAGDNRPAPRTLVPVLSTAATGLILSVLCFGLIAHEQSRTIGLRFQRESEIRFDAIQEKSGVYFEQVRALAALFRSSENVEPGEFSQFVTPYIETCPEVQAFAWLSIPSSFDATKEAQHPTVDLVQTAPAAAPEIVLALVNIPKVRDAIAAATQTDRLTAARVRGPDTPSDSNAYILCIAPAALDGDMPPGHTGVALSISEESALVEALLAGGDSDLLVTVTSADSGTTPVAQYPHHPLGPPAPRLSLWPTINGLAHTETLSMDGVFWTARFTPAPGFVSPDRVVLPWLVLGAGILFTALASAYLGTNLRRNRQLAEMYLRLKSLLDANRQTQSELDQFFELSMDLLCVVRVDGRFERLSPSFERHLGYSLDKLVHTSFMKYIHPDDQEATFAEVERLRQGQISVNFENRFRRNDGEYRWLSWNAATVSTHGTVYAIARDVTESKETIHDLSVAKNIAESASRIKSEFLANMSHELRTPLNAVIGFSDLLLEQHFGDLNPKQDEYVRNINVSGKHLLTLINDVLDLAKIEAGKIELRREDIDVEATIGAVETLVRPLAHKKSLHIAVRIEGPLTPLNVDLGRFRQVLYNLFSNAIKFTPDGGSITLEAWQTQHLESRAPGCNGTQGPWLRLDLSDTGIGIPPSDIDRIFAEFEQVDSPLSHSQEGTGLGLPLTKRLVELHGGQIWVTSDGVSGHGATFSIALPFQHQLQDIGSPSRVPMASPAPTQVRPFVMAVEDDPMAQQLLTEYLNGEGYDVAIAASRREAIEIVQRQRPDIITLDIQLPDGDGWGLLRELKKDYGCQHVPVVVVTVTDDDAIGASLGISDFVVKPVDRMQLLDALHGAARTHGRAMVIEPHAEFVTTIRELFRNYGWQVAHVTTLAEALPLLEREVPDVLILGLPLLSDQADGALERVREILVAEPTRIYAVVHVDDEDATREAVNQQATRLASHLTNPRTLVDELKRLIRVHALLRDAGTKTKDDTCRTSGS